MAKTKTKTKSELFKDWMKEKEMTLEEFAIAAGIHMSTAQKWAYCGAVPREAYADKVRAVFPDCPIID